MKPSWKSLYSLNAEPNLPNVVNKSAKHVQRVTQSFFLLLVVVGVVALFGQFAFIKSLRRGRGGEGRSEGGRHRMQQTI